MTEASQRNYLFIINDAPHGNERPYNALRLAMALAKQPESRVQVFLIGDGVGCANGFSTFRDLAAPEYGLVDKVNWFRGVLDTLGIVYPRGPGGAAQGNRLVRALRPHPLGI